MLVPFTFLFDIHFFRVTMFHWCWSLSLSLSLFFLIFTCFRVTMFHWCWSPPWHRRRFRCLVIRDLPPLQPMWVIGDSAFCQIRWFQMVCPPGHPQSAFSLPLSLSPHTVPFPHQSHYHCWFWWQWEGLQVIITLTLTYHSITRGNWNSQLPISPIPPLLFCGWHNMWAAPCSEPPSEPPGPISRAAFALDCHTFYQPTFLNKKLRSPKWPAGPISSSR